MERVHFVLRHQIEKVLDLVLVEEVAGNVQHQSAPAEARPVFNPHGRHCPRHCRFDLGRRKDLRRQELEQCLHAVEQSRPIAGGNRHAVGRRVQRVSLGAERGGCVLRGQQNRIVDRGLAIARRYRQVEPRRATDSFGQLPSDVGRVGRILVDKNGGTAVERELARSPLHPQRFRHQGNGCIRLRRLPAPDTSCRDQENCDSVCHCATFRRFGSLYPLAGLDAMPRCRHK